MSEYQYYEFQALDRPLTASEQTYVNSLSSRVQLTATNAIFTYSYGDFRGKPEELLEKCFDIMLYMANWGTRQLMFRLPRPLVDRSVLELYCLPDKITITTSKNYLILDININDEEYQDWVEAEGWLSKLVQLRDDILRGDFRALYLAWLKAAAIAIEEGEVEELVEPLIPANLKKLSLPLEAFIEFFDIDQDLVAVAARESLVEEEVSEPLEEWIAALSLKEKHDFLIKVARGEINVGVQLINHLRQLFKTPTNQVSDETDKRSFSQLLESAKEHTQWRNEQEKIAAQQEKIRKLSVLAKKSKQVWLEVYELLEFKQAKTYDQAVAHLIDLRDLAEYQGKVEEFKTHIKQMQKDYSNRTGLISRLKKVGLL
jgi:ribosomal protein S15P/S13E